MQRIPETSDEGTARGKREKEKASEFIIGEEGRGGDGQ